MPNMFVHYLAKSMWTSVKIHPYVIVEYFILKSWLITVRLQGLTCMLGDEVRWWEMVLRFIPKVLDVVEVRTLCRPVLFFRARLGKPFLYGPDVAHGDAVATTDFL